MLKSKYAACCVVLTCDSDKTDTPTHTVHKTFSRFKKCTRTERKCGYEREASVCVTKEVVVFESRLSALVAKVTSALEL